MDLTFVLILVSAWFALQVVKRVKSVYFSSLSKFPGPTIAAITSKYKLWVEAFQQKSWVDELADLHKRYGDVVRVGPNELHFWTPSAYNDIYNSRNRWDKEPGLYRSFGEDESSFGYLTHAKAKERKAILQPLFSRQSVIGLQSLVQQKIDELCEVFERYSARNEPANIFFGARCFTMDVITTYCFNRSVDAIQSPSFRAPIIEAMEASLPASIIFKHFPPIRKFIFALPPGISKKLSPDTAGLVDLQQILGKQVEEVTRNPKLLESSPHPIIYSALLNPKNQVTLPSSKSLYEEAQALMFGGGDTSGNVLFLGTLHVLDSKERTARLKTEIKTVWPSIMKRPSYEELEKLPFLTAIIKESLRLSPGVASPLLRITPASGVKIDSNDVPGNTIVGMSSIFIHSNESIFQKAGSFVPERWLEKDAPQDWLVPFSRGPRSCLGSNLAWCELYLAFANLFRRFEMKPDNIRPNDLKWRECFLPKYNGDRLNVYFDIVKN